ncbi:MAG: carbohydrate kinase [Kiritimatiellaeota bacterium]|nr:carbohydrate kinase [Kiritimatiellota bacterium]
MAIGLKTKVPIVVGIGELLWDMLPDGRQPGGAPANFAYHAAAQGTHAHIVSAVGQDPLGGELLGFLKNKSLSTNHIAELDSFPTGTVNVRMTNGIPVYDIVEDVAWDHIPFSRDFAKLAGKADAVCFGTLACRSPGSRATIFRFLEALRADCLKICDINLRQHYYSLELIEKMFKIADILKINDDEIMTVAALLEQTGTENELARSLLDKFDFQAVVLTKGAAGASYYSKGTTVSCKPANPEKAVDTVGCGDAFCAVFTTGLLFGLSPRQAMQDAERRASFVSTQNGAMPDLPTGTLF